MKLVVANLKLYLNTLEDVVNYQKEMENYKKNFIVAPQNIYLENFINKGFIVSSQNSSDNTYGPYTGEISPKSLSNLNVKYTIIGHSEVRGKYYSENEYISDKIKKALENDLVVILGVGEYDKNCVYDVIEKQLDGIEPNANLIVSYEPIWAIGGSKIPDIDDLKSIISFIKSKGYKRVLYGGSINEDNINDLNLIDNIDGFLIGSCAIKTDNFKKIIEVVK